MWLTVAPVADVPTPKSQLYDTPAPPRSEPDPLKVTALPTDAVWSGPAFATSERLATETRAVSLARLPLLSVTVSMTQYVPGVVYACETTLLDAEPPSPKVQAYALIVSCGSKESPPSNRTLVMVCVNSS